MLIDWPYFLFGYFLLLVIAFTGVRAYRRWKRYTIFIMTVPVKRDK